MKNLASGTAEGTAYMRYYESLRPIQQRICNDYLAYHLTAWWVKLVARMCDPLPSSFMDWAFEKKGRGVSGFLAVRTRVFDDFVLEKASAGMKQYVILGAGLDSRPYRFAQQLNDIEIFEVDHPLSQEVKKQRLIRYFGELPGNVNYVPVDFTIDNLAVCLGKSGFAPCLPTMFTLEGVSMYLPEEALRETLSLIQINSGPASCVILDYIYAAALDGRLQNKITRHMNSLKFIFNEPVLFGIEYGQAESFLCSLGFDRVEDFPPQKLYDLYLKSVVPNRPISDVYAVATAAKCNCVS